MTVLPDIPEALASIDQFNVRHAQRLAPEAQDRLIAATSKVSAVDRICGVVELLYSDRADLSGEALDLAVDLTEFATRNGWHGLSVDSRGTRMVAALRRQRGDKHPTGGKWPAESDDPASAADASAPAPFVPPPTGPLPTE